MDKKQSLEKSKKILNDQRGEQRGKNKTKNSGKNASRDNNRLINTTKENRHNLKNSKANKIADPIHKRTSYSQDHSQDDLSSFKNSETYQEEDGDNAPADQFGKHLNSQEQSS